MHTYMEQLRTLFSIITYETFFSLGIHVKAGLSACSRANFVYCGIESELTPIFVTTLPRNRRGSATRKLQINSNSKICKSRTGESVRFCGTRTWGSVQKRFVSLVLSFCCPVHIHLMVDAYRFMRGYESTENSLGPLRWVTSVPSALSQRNVRGKHSQTIYTLIYHWIARKNTGRKKDG